MAPLDWFEWCLFLFTEKDWGALVTCVACVDVKGLPRGPHRSVIFDLAWLCKYRLLLRGKTKLAAQVEKWLIENRAEMPKEQAAVFEAFDRFLAADPNGDPNEIIAAAKGYTPYFALSAVRTLYPAETPFAHANVIPHE